MKTLFKRLLLCFCVIVLLFSSVGCSDKKSDYEQYLEFFDLDQEKSKLENNYNLDFSLDTVVIITKRFKNTDLYPILSLEYLKMEEAIGFEFIIGPNPSDYMFQEGYEDKLANFSQMILIYLKPQEKDKLIEIVEQIKELEFVYNAMPSWIATGGC